MRLVHLVISLTLILFLFTGCFTVPKKDKVNKVNTVELEGWGTITFVDELYCEGEKANGTYWKDNKGKHHIVISRKTDSFERTFLHEFQHPKDLWHETEEEKKAFDEKMAEYGSLKEELCEVKTSKRNKGKIKNKKTTVWKPHSAEAE